MPYIVKALQAIEGKKFEIDRTLNIVAFSPTSAIRSIKADTWVENPSTLFDDIEPESTIVIPVNGAISKYDNCGMYGTHTYSMVLNNAANHKNVKSVILNFDSPGGTADGSYDMAMAVKRLAQTKNVISYADGLLASAAYRIAAQSTMIVAKPGSTIGSIGTMITLTDYSEYFKKQGIKEIDVYASKSTNKNEDWNEAIKGNTLPLIEHVLDPMNDLFLNEMKEARNLPDEALTGRVFDPVKAKELNMIDVIGDMHDVINFATKSKNTSMKFIDQIKALLDVGQGENAKNNIMLPLEGGGEAEVVTDAEEPAVGDSVLVDGAPAPDADHVLTDGTVVTTVGGVITAITPKVDDPVPAPTTDVSAMAEEVKSLTAKLETVEKSLNAVVEMQKSITELQSAVQLIAKATKSNYVAPIAGAPTEPTTKRTGTKRPNN